MSDESKPAPVPHTVADHQYGEDALHTHDEGAEYDHDHDHFDGPDDLEANPIWQQDHIALVSVGIDIGSAGTQVLFSRVSLRRRGEDLSSRYFVVAREAIYQSPVALTPYQSETRIDEHALGAIVDDAYASANIHPDNVDAGAVILTGEALRRENAQAIADVLADQVGEFVCAAAGHHMEAMLAAYGSGAAKASHDLGKRILNIDIGGGTTKLAVVEAGKVVATAAFHVGGRLLVVDGERRITHLDPGGQRLAAAAGFDWKLGDVACEADVERVAKRMADIILEAVSAVPLSDFVERLYLTEPIDTSTVEAMMFSGGVGEYVYERESREFGDWGRALGRSVASRIAQGRFAWPLLPAGECIRATALGASEYSVQLSGNTTFISSPGRLLPRRNLQVVQPDVDLSGAIDASQVARRINEHFTRFDVVEGEAEIALAFRWQGLPTYDRLAAFAEGVVRALPRTIEHAQPIYLILDGDVAQTLGALLSEEFAVASDVFAIDGITLWDFDYVDLGRIRFPSNTVPVTIKSLVFQADPRALAMEQEHEHRNSDGSVYRHRHGHAHSHGPSCSHDHAHSHDHHHGPSRGHVHAHGQAGAGGPGPAIPSASSKRN
jgi:ethanolamine utilization protein EutA